MKTKTIKTLLLAATAILGACASPLTTSGPTARPPKYAPPPPPSQYGDWYIEPQSCTIRARAADFTLSTDGIPSNNTIGVKAVFTSPLVQPPRVEISEILAPIPVEGSRRGYGIILAYDSNNAAHMMKDDTFLMVRYQPLTSTEILESSFQTRGLMFALADLAKYCEQ